MSLDEVRAVFETNVFGVIAATKRCCRCFVKHQWDASFNVSSTSGSLTWNSDPANPHRKMFGTYSSSKTALNAITFAFAADLESTGIKVNAAYQSPSQFSREYRLTCSLGHPRIAHRPWNPG